MPAALSRWRPAWGGAFLVAPTPLLVANVDTALRLMQANKVMNWLTTNCKVTMVNSVV